MNWDEMPDGVLDGMQWLLGNLCLALLSEQWDEVGRKLPYAIDDLRDQLSTVPDLYAQACEQLSDCLDLLDRWAEEPTPEGLMEIEREYRVAERSVEQVEEAYISSR